MDAICETATFIFGIAMEEGIDFMSEASYGLEMISPEQFEGQDLHYTSILADWTHQRDGLFWYHNCGQTKGLIRSGQFDIRGNSCRKFRGFPANGSRNGHVNNCLLLLHYRSHLLEEIRRHIASVLWNVPPVIINLHVPQPRILLREGA